MRWLELMKLKKTNKLKANALEEES